MNYSWRSNEIIILHTPKPAKIDKNRSAVQCQQPSPASALIFSLSIRKLNRLKCHDMNYEGFSVYAYNNMKMQ
ncbi:uncharacterized protein OCT59_027845 [Rhizophagus irregularis]|uniref:uncharacterized protein n=1 Tax=Rhizophagus irregularis TaxID=588596 RepID=UPI001A10214A|nr:hypothetical protein OCT59_027845 [Rhizophagus irregularis]GET56761.1 hypothetical protein RIR_jg13892.t1 [Rhizophagus irregularis DAOM 181602=DAOM 197198]